MYEHLNFGMPLTGDGTTPAKRKTAPSAKRIYGAARQSRLTADFYAPNNSADAELVSSLTLLRSRSRSLIRDASYAKRAKVVVMNNVIGTGIGMQAQVTNQRGRLMTDVNDAIEGAWCEWMRADNCHTGGKLHFHDLERQAMGQIFEAGEVLLRKHYRPFGSSAIPFALELIEAERLADGFTMPSVASPDFYRMGVERDIFGRPTAFYIRQYHPGEYQLPALTHPDLLSRIPADQMWHLYVCDRWPQTRGEPWLHSALRRLNDMNGLSESEIVAARAAAAYMLWIETPEAPSPDNAGEDGASTQPLTDIEPGIVQYGAPGEKPTFIAPNRPNPNLDPFMRFMLREVAAGAMVTYEAISGDYSQSNFSSSRLGQVDARDCWRAIQQFFIRSFREALHREWLQAAVLSRAIPAIDLIEYGANPRKFEAVLFKPRGWTYIDPVKDVAAAKDAVKGGLTTLTDVIAEYGNGKDIEDVVTTRKREIEMLAEAGIITDTDPALVLSKGETDANTPPGGQDSSQPARAGEARVLPMRPK